VRLRFGIRPVGYCLTFLPTHAACGMDGRDPGAVPVYVFGHAPAELTETKTF